MNKILTIMILLSFSVYSQNNIHDIFLSIYPKNGIKEINIKKLNKKKFIIGVDDFSNLNQSSKIELYFNEKEKTPYILIPINFSNDFVLFILYDKDELKINCKNTLSNVNSNYLIFDKIRKVLIYLKPFSGGSITKRKIDTIEFLLSKEIENEIFFLNNFLMPIGSFENFNDSDENLQNSFSKYEINQKRYVKKTKKIKLDYENVCLIPYSELLSIINSKEFVFDKSEICNNNYCNCDISRFFIR